MNTDLQQQIENVEMALVMWSAVPPQAVVAGLETWRCGTQACFGGHLARWKYFRKLGVTVNYAGAPQIRIEGSASSVSAELFCNSGLFDLRGCAPQDDGIIRRYFEVTGRAISDHELVKQRLLQQLEWLERFNRGSEA